MIERVRISLILCSFLLPAACLLLLTTRQAAAQSNEERRGGGDEGERGERGEGRERRGRGRWGGGEGEGGRRGFSRRGGGDGERGGDRGSENQGGDRPPRPGSTSGSNGPSRAASGSGAGSLSTNDYVRGLFKQYDKDGDMMLKGDELKGLSGKSASADANNDGVITMDEMVATLSGNAPAAAASGSSSGTTSESRGKSEDKGERSRRNEATSSRVYTATSGGGKGGKSSEDSSKAEKQRAYRFTRGTDRLPSSGLPSWFKSRDANGDGQVSMSEYSRTWTDSLAAEFRRYDLDNDGVVTAKEATGK